VPFDPPLDFGIDLASIRDRVRDLGYFNAVETVERALLAFEGLGVLPPAAFVSTASESAVRLGTIGGPETYRVTTDISTLFCIPAEQRDDGALDIIEKARRSVMIQLVNWTPEGAETPLRYRRWLIKAVAEGLIWGEVITFADWRFTA
jgi:hypothetical protein